MRTSIHQLVHTLSYGDAISTEVLALQKSFREAGCGSEIYAINVHPLLKGQAKDYKDLPSDFDGEIVFHLSLGSPLTDVYINLKKAFKTVIYHNLTPPRWFENVNPRIVSDIKQGQKELPIICDASDRIIADSKYNASELSKYKVEVLELPLDSKKWGIESNLGFASLASANGEFNILHVGRLAPNKCIEDIIKIFYFFHHYSEKKSRLWLVGIDIDTELYSFSLKRLVEELSLSEAVVFPGCLADEELKALYENSSAYLCMSEHEGFCLPLLEAMHFKVPVIAYAATAVPDTLGNGGIIVEEKRHAEIAELLDKVCKDLSLREKLIDSGLKRVAELSLDKFQSEVKAMFLTQDQTIKKVQNN